MVSNIFYFYPYLGKWSNLTSIFFRWVVQPPTSSSFKYTKKNLFCIDGKLGRCNANGISHHMVCDLQSTNIEIAGYSLDFTLEIHRNTVDVLSLWLEKDPGQLRFIPLLTIYIGFDIHPFGDRHHQVAASANLYFTGSTYHPKATYPPEIRVE